MNTEKVIVRDDLYFLCSQRLPRHIKNTICDIIDTKVMPSLAHDALHYDNTTCATYLAQMLCLRLMRELYSMHEVTLVEGVVINDGMPRESDLAELANQAKTYHVWLMLDREYLVDAGAMSIKLDVLPESAYLSCTAWNHKMHPLRSIKKVLRPPDGIKGCMSKHFVSQNVPIEASHIIDRYSGLADIVAKRFGSNKTQIAAWVLAKALDDFNIPHGVALATRTRTEQSTSGKRTTIITFDDNGIVEPYSRPDHHVWYKVEDEWDSVDAMINETCIDPKYLWHEVNGEEDEDLCDHPAYLEPMRAIIADFVDVSSRAAIDSPRLVPTDKKSLDFALSTLRRYLEYEYGDNIDYEAKPTSRVVEGRSIWTCAWEIAESALSCDFELTKIGPVIHDFSDDADGESIMPQLLRHPQLVFAESYSRVYV